jgi:Zn-dependent protease with chaperone function/type II secretory pathway pseudopilin PulG
MISLSAQNVVSPKEKSLFVIALILAILAWGLLTLISFGMIWMFLAVIGIVLWFSNGLLVAGLKADAVAVHPQQVGKLDVTLREVCIALGLAKVPELYVLQSGGALNAFATQHTGRHFVVIYSDMLDAYGPDSAEMKFLLGHEVGHIQRHHLMRRMLLAPALFLPIIGPAYSRACESTCDRYGALAAGDAGAAMRAMMMLAGGKEAGREMDVEHFAQQNQLKRGFFVSWYELISGYPTLTRRVNDLGALRGEQPAPRPSRHPLSYLFSLVSFGGGFGGRGSIITTLIFIYFIGIFAALALPAVTGALQKAKSVQELSNAKQIFLALEQASLDGKIVDDKTLGFPADAHITSVSQLKQILVKNRYLTDYDLIKLGLDHFAVGNVSENDPDNTIVLRNSSVIFYKRGNGAILRRGQQPSGIDPPRSPAYLVP